MKAEVTVVQNDCSQHDLLRLNYAMYHEMPKDQVLTSCFEFEGDQVDLAQNPQEGISEQFEH